jgi:hypothetical protein
MVFVCVSRDKKDEGTYYCVSKNEMGVTRGNIQVYSKCSFVYY